MTSVSRSTPAVVCLFCLLLPLAIQAQVFPRGNGFSLTGLKQTDLYLNVTDWIAMPGDADDFRLAAQQTFEQALKAGGIRRSSANRHYLVCEVQAITTGAGVAYTATVELWNLRSIDVHTLLWTSSSLSAVAADAFDAGDVGDECASQFLTEWSRWNS